jgi:hypothetical protein
VSDDSRTRVRPIVLSVLIGLAVALLVVAAVYAAYPPPSQSDSKLQGLQAQQKQLEAARSVTGGLSGRHEKIYQRLLDDIADATKAVAVKRDIWVRNASILGVALATLLMGVSFVFAKRNRVLSDGLLLGGFVVMLCGTILSFTGGWPTPRYAVLAVAVVVTSLCVYMRFGRTSAHDEDAAGRGTH